MNHSIEISPNHIRLLLALFVLFLAAAPGNGNATAAVHVRTAEVSKSSLDSPEVSYSAVLSAADRARLAFTDGGRLVSRPVKIGTQVKFEQVLVKNHRAHLVKVKTGNLNRDRVEVSGRGQKIVCAPALPQFEFFPDSE